jgi:hypothetical protein
MPCMPARGRGMRFQTPKKRCRRNHTRAQVLVAKTFPRRSQTSIAEVLEDFCHEDNWVKADWPPPTTTAACKVVRDCARRHSSQTRSQKGRQLDQAARCRNTFASVRERLERHNSTQRAMCRLVCRFVC